MPGGLARFLKISFLLCLAASMAAAADSNTKKDKAIPYLGPGADKLSAQDYERVYKNYIQSSILLGYPFLKEKAPPCDQALTQIFRSAGMFAYPVPSEAQQVQRSTKTIAGKKVETYELAGFLIQLSRAPDSDGLEKLVLLNSSSPRAMRRLSGFAKKEFLTLAKDPATGLERVHGIPVGYPHPYLTSEGQGLTVKVLSFNGKKENCAPLDFQDNAWVGGFDLSQSRCTELQAEAEKVWNEKISPEDFAQRELQRMKDTALKSALAKGVKEDEAKALIAKHFAAPLSNEINVVGSAMRNLAQCNLLALSAGKQKGGTEPTTPGKESNGGSGTAQ